MTWIQSTNGARPTCMRSPWVALITIVSIALGAHGASAETFHYSSVLSGQQVTTPTGSPALGGGLFIIDTDANTVTYRIAFAGLTAAETMAHIHGPADPGTNAGVLTSLPLGNPKVGVWSYAQAQENDILAGKTYVNIHTGAFPGGEVRGQIAAFNATLDGAQVVPPVTTPGRGWGVFQINTTTNELSYYVVVDNLAGVEFGSHFHGPALHGTPASFAAGMPLGSPKIGTWAYDQSQEQAIVDGRYYVKVHTDLHPTGEVRGQIVPVVVPIDGQQEVPPVPSPGAGIALLSIDHTTDELGFDVRFGGLAGAETMAHIHGFAPPGANAGVLFTLPLGNRKLGAWAYGAGNEGDLLAGLTYFNIHSTFAPTGEIRGQIIGLPEFDTSSVDPVPATASSLALTRMAPNPLPGKGRIQFQLEQPSTVHVEIYDAQGRLVRDLGERQLSAGPHAVAWDGRDGRGRAVESGVYHYVLTTPRGQVSRPVSLVR